MTYTVMGWFELRADEDADLDRGVAYMQEARRKRFEGLREEIDGIDWGERQTVEVRQANFNEFLVILGTHNHERDIGVLDNLLAHVSAAFPETYGLIHEHNDEVGEQWWNKFRLRVMIRGKLSEIEDPFFSPIQPTIEDGEGP